MRPIINTMLDPVVNFGKVTVSMGYNDTETSIVLNTGDGSKLPDPSVDGSFNLVWFNSSTYAGPDDDPYVEIVRCIARVGDTLTLMRGQEDTSLSNKNIAGKTYKMILSITKHTISDIQTDAQSKVDTHAALTTVHGSTSSTTPSTIIQRDVSGRAKVAIPSDVDDIARKDTVDAVQINLDTAIGTTLPGLVATHAGLSVSTHGVSASGFEDKANKNAANGYAGTDANNYIVLSRFQPITTVTVPYAIGSDDYTVVCGTAITVTLPNAVGIPGRIYNIKNTSIGTVTVATTSSQTIDGNITRLISTTNELITVQSNNENWIVI